MIINAMSDSASQRRQEKRKSGRQNDFGQILEEQKRQQEEIHSMEGKTIGYSRNGQLLVGQAMQRAYN